MQVLTSDAEEKPSALNDYHLGNVDIQCANKEKDLGVMIRSILTWENQVRMLLLKRISYLISFVAPVPC